MITNHSLVPLVPLLPLFFALTVIANIAVMSLGGGKAPLWLTYLPLLPLALLLLSGLNLFVLPYAAKRRREE